MKSAKICIKEVGTSIVRGSAMSDTHVNNERVEGLGRSYARVIKMFDRDNVDDMNSSGSLLNNMAVQRTKMIHRLNGIGLSALAERVKKSEIAGSINYSVICDGVIVEDVNVRLYIFRLDESVTVTALNYCAGDIMMAVKESDAVKRVANLDDKQSFALKTLKTLFDSMSKSPMSLISSIPALQRAVKGSRISLTPTTLQVNDDADEGLVNRIKEYNLMSCASDMSIMTKSLLAHPDMGLIISGLTNSHDANANGGDYRLE